MEREIVLVCPACNFPIESFTQEELDAAVLRRARDLPDVAARTVVCGQTQKEVPLDLWRSQHHQQSR